ncbi:MAG: orotidine 5'-phosphate decarboxylase / HUMPS family protein [Anaerolineales bacterium]
MTGLDNNVRYLQIAFNYDLGLALQTLPRIPLSDRILIEAGTPFIKLEGMRGIQAIRQRWLGHVVADLKVTDGALGEVDMAHQAGATAATVLGNAPVETIELFIQRCSQLNMLSMIDLIGVGDPLDILRPLHRSPDIIVIHRGRDEESTRGKMIRYRQINRIRSKYDCLISAAGGVDLREARSAIFNGANIVVANIVRPHDGWTGIQTTEDITAIAKTFLETIS